MSRHASRFRVGFGSVAAGVLALRLAAVEAQTIADYSRAQRALLENTMTQAAARSAGMGASAPAPSPATAVATSAVATPAGPAPRAPLPPLATAVQVSGVFASRDGAVAEVVVNATPYLLGVGQGVPGTAWHVEAIAIDRVVLSRHGGGVATSNAPAGREIFELPALPAAR